MRRLRTSIYVSITLIGISIDDNVIGNEGAVALAEVLKTHKSITEVGICMNTITNRIS